MSFPFIGGRERAQSTSQRLRPRAAQRPPGLVGTFGKVQFLRGGFFVAVFETSQKK